MRKAGDFRAYCEKVKMPPDGNITYRYINSGGRPGLVKADVDVGENSYSITARRALFDK